FPEGVGVTHHHRIESGRSVRTIIGIDAGQVGAYQLHGGGAAGLERGAQLGDGNLGDLDHALDSGCKGLRQGADIYDSRTAEGRKRECTDSPSRSASGAPATA